MGNFKARIFKGENVQDLMYERLKYFIMIHAVFEGYCFRLPVGKAHARFIASNYALPDDFVWLRVLFYLDLRGNLHRYDCRLFQS